MYIIYHLRWGELDLRACKEQERVAVRQRYVDIRSDFSSISLQGLETGLSAHGGYWVRQLD